MGNVRFKRVLSDAGLLLAGVAVGFFLRGGSPASNKPASPRRHPAGTGRQPVSRATPARTTAPAPRQAVSEWPTRGTFRSSDVSTENGQAAPSFREVEPAARYPDGRRPAPPLRRSDLIYGALLQRAHRIEEANLDRLEQERREREADWSRTPPYEELLARAEQVDAFVNRRLAPLADRYRFSDDQIERIAPLLASLSPAYHPALETATDPGRAAPESTAASPTPYEPTDPVELDEKIYENLDETQKSDFEEDWVEKDEWWSGIISEFEQDLDRDLRRIEHTADSLTVEEPAETPAGDGGTQDSGEEYQGGGNLFDLVK